MTQKELKKRISKHYGWIADEEDGERLVIGAKDDIRGLEFIREDLREASFKGADLSNVHFCHCKLQGVNFDDAIFNNTDFDNSIIICNDDLILQLAKSIEKSKKQKSLSDMR